MKIECEACSGEIPVGEKVFCLDCWREVKNERDASSYKVIAELEAEVERLKKRIKELEPEPFPHDNEPVAWVCPPNNLEKRFEEKEK